MPTVGEQELVAHLFAPLDGPHASAALAQVRAVWRACRSRLGMTQPIVETGLADELPDDPATAPDGPLAALEDPSADFQAVARREHDVLNLSIAMAAPQGAPRRRRGMAAVLPPGWPEFTRWWDQLTAGGTDALLGEALVYLGKTEQASSIDIRTAVPARADDGDRWWERGATLDGFAYWEVTPRGFPRARRLVLLARPEEDERISRLAWSTGDAGMPTLGRYLMHAARLRYLGRVHAGGQEPTRLRDRATGRLDRLTGLLAGHERVEEVAALRGDLVADEAAINATLEALERMARSVEIGREHLTDAIAEPALPDAELAGRLARLIADDIGYLESVRKRAERTRDLEMPPAATVPPEARAGRSEHRIGFGVDVVGYGRRSAPAQFAVQDRIAAVLTAVLHGLGIEVEATDRQPAGDGLMVVLPPGLEAPAVLPKLLHGWRAQLAADNAAHPEDHVRLRLSAGSGPLTAAALGFAGRSIVEVGRLLNSETLHTAVRERPDADVVVLVAPRLYDDVVGEGYPGLHPAQFERVPVEVKEHRSHAWLWTGGAVSPRGLQ